MNNEVRKIHFNMPTNDSFTIISESILALKHMYKTDYVYKKGGVILSNILPYDDLQLNCFDDDICTRKHIMNVMDDLNERFGRSKIYFGINGHPNEFKLRQSFLSPNYTTNINEIFKVHS